LLDGDARTSKIKVYELQNKEHREEFQKRMTRRISDNEVRLVEEEWKHLIHC
jgi:hypothetical protein